MMVELIFLKNSFSKQLVPHLWIVSEENFHVYILGIVAKFRNKFALRSGSPSV